MGICLSNNSRVSAYPQRAKLRWLNVERFHPGVGFRIRRFHSGVRFRINARIWITARVRARIRIRVRARGLGFGLGFNPA